MAPACPTLLRISTFFPFGVASADPRPDRVLLWTRPALPGAVSWEVAADPGFRRVVAAGQVVPRPEHDLTVHVEAGGLSPATGYWYRFSRSETGERSTVGRTRTAPAGEVDRLRLGVVSCSSLPGGFFSAYRHLTRRDVDLVVHLGDYLYEAGHRRGGRVRQLDPLSPPVTLADYRARHAQHRKDPDLQALHSRHPVAVMWDDHDIAGGAWSGGASRHDPDRQGPWPERLAAGRKAWREWVPAGSPEPAEHPHLYRRLGLGSLADLVLLDTRYAGRDRPALGGWATPAVLRRNRSMLGAEQWSWLEAELRRPPARWTLVGSSVVLSPLRALARLLVNPDQWDGYPGERRRLLDLLSATGRRGAVVLAGDLHSSWATELPAGDAVELVTPAVSAPSMAEMLLVPVPGLAGMAARWFRLQNGGVRFSEIEGHGYLLVELDRERLRAEWWHVDQVRQAGASERCVAAFETAAGSGRLVESEPPDDAGYDSADGAQAALSPSADSSGKVR